MYHHSIVQQRHLKKQHGATFLGMAIIAGGLIFVAIIGMKMAPAYIEFMSVKKVLKTMKNDPAFSTMSSKELRQSFDKRKSIDDITSVNKEDLVIEKNEAGETVVSVDYQVQRPLMGNVTALIDFQATSDSK